MGNLISCFKKSKEGQLVNQCPYCKFFFSSENEKKLHIRNCVYNVRGDDREPSIYSEPYKI